MAKIKKLEASKEQARDKATDDELKEQAQELIAAELKAAKTRKAGEDEGLYAERLLSNLEPIVCEYAPPPKRIMRIVEDKRMLSPDSRLRLGATPDQKLAKPTKDVYGDKKGARLARKRHKGWTKVKY